MKNRNYKILVLADLKDSVSTTLKSTVRLAKMINAEMTLFCVKKPTDVVKKDNQLSAIREINHEYTTANNTIKNLVKSISDTFDIPINYSFTVGHVKNEIKQYLAKNQPDIVVMSKRKSKLLNLAGDQLTPFILKHHAGAILIVDKNNSIEPDRALLLGVFNGMEQTQNTAFTEHLLAHTQKPVKSFKIAGNANSEKNVPPSGDGIVEFTFEQNDDSIKNLSNYLAKNNINLLYINRTKYNSKSRFNTTKQDLNGIINNLNVSLFISGEEHENLV